MTLPPSGRVDQIPLARVVGRAVVRRSSGTLRVEQDGRRWSVDFKDGDVVGGDSATPEDQVGRIALEAGFVDATQVGESLRRMASSGKSQLDVLREMGALDAEKAERVARVVLARRATRLFSLPTATFAFEERTVPAAPGGPLDARWAIYRGLRLFGDERRMERDLGDLNGKAIKLQVPPASVQDSFGFADEERIVLAYLEKGYWELGDLIDACVSLARPIVLAVVTSLWACEYLEVQPADSVPRLRKRAREQTQRLSTDAFPQFASKTPGDQPPAVYRTPPTSPPQRPLGTPITSAPAGTRPPSTASTPSTSPPVSFRPPGTSPPATAGNAAKPPTNPPQGATEAVIAEKLRLQIAAKAKRVEQGADHFQVLEIERNASKEQIKAAYFALAKTYHPDRLALLRLEDLRPQVELIFSKLSEAFGTLADDTRRKEYMNILAQGGEVAVRKKEDAEAAKAVAILTSEEHFRRGEMALRRQQWTQAQEEFKKALDLNGDEGEHHAMYAWATWCAAADKDKILADVKKGLNRAIELNAKCAPAFYFLGQVFKTQGDMDKAYNQFQRCVSLQPGHVDAEREIRVIDMRRAKGPEKKGLFDRFKKK